MITKDQLEVGKTYDTVGGLSKKTVLFIGSHNVFFRFDNRGSVGEASVPIASFCKASSLPKRKISFWMNLYKDHRDTNTYRMTYRTKEEAIAGAAKNGHLLDTIEVKWEEE